MANEQGTTSTLSGRMLTDEGILDAAVLAWEGTRITFAGPAQAYGSAGGPDRLPSGGPHFPADALILPGLVDLHCHGGHGGDFTSGSPEQIRAAVSYLHRSGTTTLLASTGAAPGTDLLRAFPLLAAAAEAGLIAGIHAEGPFLSPARSGVHDPAFLQEPDEDLLGRLVAAAGGHLISMTYAPELPGTDSLVYELVTHGVIPAIGHTDCSAEEASAALDLINEELASTGFDGFSGRPMATHLFNAMPAIHHRSPGPVPLLLERARAGEIAVELIADNIHLHADTVRMAFIMAGSANICLVSDSTAAAGKGDGVYRLGRAEITVSGGAARVGTGEPPAGGTRSLLDVVRCAAEAGVGLEDAVRSATAVPAGILGLADELGSLRTGLRADAVVVSAQLELLGVLRAGTWLRVPEPSA